MGECTVLINYLRIAMFGMFAGLTFAAPAAAQDEIKSPAENEQGCAEGNADSCYLLGAAYYNGSGVEADRQRAVELFSQACDQGFGASCDTLGIMANDGDTLPQDFEVGARYLTRGCEAGYALSCHHLSNAYRTGEGVPQDMGRFAELAGQACDWDEAMACRNLGIFNRTGDGGAVDMPRAANYFTRSCDLGMAASCVDLAIAHYGGDGVEQSFTRAEELLRPACEGDIARGCYILAVLYQNGEGVEQSLPEAVSLFSRACRSGYEQGCAIIAGASDNCVAAYSDIATDSEFGPETPMVLSFIGEIGGDARQLFENRTLGMAVALREYESGYIGFDVDNALSSLDPGEAEILIWPGQQPHYIQASPQLTDTASALGFIEGMCSLVEHGVLVTKVNSFIILAQYNAPSE